MTIYIFSLFVSFLLSTIATSFFRRLAVKWGFLDSPDKRKIHLFPTPLLGGAAIIISFYLTAFLGIFLNPLFQKRFTWEVLVIFIGGGAIFLLGLIDDRYSLKPWQKLFFQLMAVGSVVFLLSRNGMYISNPFYIFGFPKTIFLNTWTSFLVNLLWLVFMINAFNFIDGIDGLASSVALVSSLSLFLISLNSHKILSAYFFLTLTGTLIGFARYNNYPAQIFLGDSGSMFLGYILAALSIFIEGKSTATFSFIFPLLIFGIPIYDTLMVIAKRASQGESIFNPDTNHFHHRLLKSGFTPKQIVIIAYLLSLLLGGVTFLLLLLKNEFAALVTLMFSLIGINATERFLKKNNEKTKNKQKSQDNPM